MGKKAIRSVRNVSIKKNSIRCRSISIKKNNTHCRSISIKEAINHYTGIFAVILPVLTAFLTAFLTAVFISISFLVLSSTGACAQSKKEIADKEIIDKGTKLSITLEETREPIPDILALDLKVDVTTAKEAEAINILGAIDNVLRNLNLDYKGGKYSVYKNCWWEKGKQRCTGYKGSIGYLFELKNAASQNQIFEALERFKERYEKKMSLEEMNFSVSQPEWRISEKEYHKVEDELKFKIIDTAKDFSDRVSKKLGKTCYISDIDYDVKRPLPIGPYYGAKAANLMERSIDAPEPKKEEKTVSVRAGVKLRCE